MKLKMKRLLGILLSLTLVIGLMPGMNLTVYAGTPERDYSPISHPNPLNYVADTGNVSGWLVNWVYIKNDGKEKGPQQTAVTLGAANGHRNNLGLTNIYIHVSYAEEPVKQSEPTALHVFAENEGTANITLEGMAIAETAGSNAPGNPTAIKAESSSGGQTTVTAKGQVIAGEDTDCDYIDHTLVNASSTGEGSSTTVTLLNTADGDVKISAADGGKSVINIDNEGQGLGRRATLSSNDDGSLAQLNLKEGNVSEIRFCGEDGKREANINGDVKIQVESNFIGGEANTNITGNLGDPNVSQSGINATVKKGGTANYDVDGTIYGHVYLNENRNEDNLDGANINVQAANVEGNVSIGSQHDSKYKVTIKEDITAKEDALKIRNNNSEVNVDVQGSITSNGGTGIAVNNARERIYYENTDVTNVNVGEDLIVKGESKELTGISVRSDNKFNETNINIGDNVKVTSLDTNKEGDHTATGIRVDTLEGDININVATDLVVEGGVNDTGIVLNRHAHDKFAASDAEKVNPEELNGTSLGDQIIDGKVVQVYEAEQEDGTALYYDEEGNVYDCVTVANEGTTQIVIGRDVISDGNGVELTAAGEEKTDLIIDGSLVATGGTSVVIKNDDMVLGDNLTLTTWKMKADQDGDYVKREKYDKILNNKIFVADREAEKAIQYIIRVDEKQKNIIHIDGTTRYKDRDVAKEGDKIVVKVDVPEGFAIDEIYCDNNKTKLSQDNNGEYFMIVPRGGGVLLSANFRESKEVTVKEEPKPISVTYTGSAQELVTAGTAEGGTIQYAIGTDATTAPTTGFTTSIPTGTNADNYFVWFKAVADNKYDTDGETLCLPVSISKAIVTVTADDKTKSYGTVDTELTAKVTGLKGTDTEDMIVYTLSRAAGENAGTYAITPAGDAEQGNYKVTYVNGTYTIEKVDPTYTVPTGLTALTGKTLSYVNLPNGWTWMDKGASVGAAGAKTFKAVYTPEDTVNYNTVEDIDVVVTVSEPAPEPEVKEPEFPYTTNETVTNKDGSITKKETTFNKDGSKTEKSVREYLNGNKTTMLSLTNDKGVNLIRASETIKTNKKGTKTVSTNIQAINGYNYQSEVKTTKSGKEVSEVKITNADKSSSYEKTVTYPDGNITKNSVKTKADGTADITFGKYTSDTSKTGGKNDTSKANSGSASGSDKSGSGSDKSDSGTDKSASEAFASDILAGMTPSSGFTGSDVFGTFGSKVDNTTVNDMVTKISDAFIAPNTALPADAEIVEELANTVTSDKKVKLVKCITVSEKVTIPSKITINGTSYTVTTIRKNAFKKASSVKCVVLGKTITKFGKKAFNGISKDAVFVMKVKSDTRKKIAKLIKKSGYKNPIQVLYSANK